MTRELSDKGREYIKIGLGGAGAVVGTINLGNLSLARLVMQEAMYRSLDTINPETLTKAYQALEEYRAAHGPSVLDGLSIVLLAGGIASMASGIYNLARSLKK